VKVRPLAFAVPTVLLAGCPGFFPFTTLPGAMSRPPDGTMVAPAPAMPGLIAQYGPVAGRWRIKLFDRGRTREFSFDAETAGRHVSGRLAPLNEDSPPKWTVDGLLSETAASTLSLSIGSTTSAEPATTSITVVAHLRYGEYGFASPAPAATPTPTPYPTPVANSGSVPTPGPYYDRPPEKVPYGPPGAGFGSYTLLGTWEEGQASGSATAIRVVRVGS